MDFVNEILIFVDIQNISSFTKNYVYQILFGRVYYLGSPKSCEAKRNIFSDFRKPEKGRWGQRISVTVDRAGPLKTMQG